MITVQKPVKSEQVVSKFSLLIGTTLSPREFRATYPVLYPDSLDLKLLTYSFLEGCELFNKIAVTSKRMRNSIIGAGLLDQIKIITVKPSTEDYPKYLPKDSFLYAIDLADVI